MVRWTKEQQMAIDTRDTNILVAAAAGSGKTAVLVERIIQRILDEDDPLDIDQLLVATFTNAAAEEMRSRIGLALEKAIQENPTSRHLKKQLSLLQKAHISTIHSFCMNIVRQYSYLIDIDPAFRIADDLEIDLIKHEVMDELFETYYGQEGHELEIFFQLADMYSNDRSDAQLEQLILKLHTFAKQHPWPEHWLQEVAAVYNVTEESAETDLTWLSILKTEIKEQLQMLQEQLQQALSIAMASDGPNHYAPTLQQDLALIAEALRLTDDWDQLQRFFTTTKIASLRGKKFTGDLAKLEEVKALREQFRKMWNEVKKKWFSRDLRSHLRDMEKLYPLVKKLVEIVLEFEARFQQVKRERNVVDFNDLEHFSLQILLDEQSTPEQIIPSNVALHFAQQFKEILVDEYQDINLVQETILRVISKQEAQGNVFMVGDVKQSIYRFRHAEPTLFIEKYNEYARQQHAGKRIDLAKNFRSRQEILAGANYIFRQIFDEVIGEISYDKQAELVYGNTSYLQHESNAPKTEVIIIDRETDEASEDEDEAKQLTNMQLEAKLYVQKIREWIGAEKGEPLQVIDKKTGQPRSIRYRDIVILLRSLTEATTIADELKKYGIPVYAELKSGYFAALEVQIMLNVLKIIDNPYQDIPLVSVLRSPIVGLNEDELAKIRLAAREATFYQAVVKYARQQNELAARIRNFLQLLTKFRKLAREQALSEVIWTIFQETGYYDYVGGIPGGRQRQANLRALYDRARMYEQTSFRGLFRFLRFIEAMQEKKSDLGEARALSEQEDVVRIMTIHKSKGLEFPVVILGNIHKQFNFTDLTGKYLINKEYGFATKFIDPAKRIMYPTLYHLAVHEEEKRKMLSEEMRVLYVALTRAKEKLVLVGNVASFQDEVQKWQAVVDHPDWILPAYIRKRAKSYLDWIGPALIRHERSNVLHEGKVATEVLEAIRQDEANWHIEVIKQQDISVKDAVQQKAEETLQEAITKWQPIERSQAPHPLVEERLTFQYPYQSALMHRAKQSVTELKRRQEQIDAYSDRKFVRRHETIASVRPQFLQKEKVLSASEVGTAMHTVMQHIPLTKKWTENDIRAFLEELVAAEKLTEAEKAAIDVKAIAHFFTTDVGAMLLTNEVHREVPFTYALRAKDIYPDWTDKTDEKVLIQGVIDCVIFTENGVILLDYKTDYFNPNKDRESFASMLQKRYEMQLSLYKKALEEILRVDVTDVYIYAFQANLLVKL